VAYETISLLKRGIKYFVLQIMLRWV